MLLLKIAIAAAVVWWLFFRGKGGPTKTGVIQLEGQPDFDPVTANQLNGAVKGDVTLGDEWSASFVTGDGNWSDAYRSHASEPDPVADEPGGLPL
jgi:hypothetical protein